MRGCMCGFYSASSSHQFPGSLKAPLMRCHVPAQSFVQPEKLDSAEAWYCPRCKEHVQASKKLDLWTTPEVLILHLKRFQYTTQSRRKIDAPITFPLTGLDLLPYLIKQQVQLSLAFFCQTSSSGMLLVHLVAQPQCSPCMAIA